MLLLGSGLSNLVRNNQKGKSIEMKKIPHTQESVPHNGFEVLTADLPTIK